MRILIGLLLTTILIVVVPIQATFPEFVANPHGPWIGEFYYGLCDGNPLNPYYPTSNPLITTNEANILVSNLVVHTGSYATPPCETNIVIDASTGSVRKRTDTDDDCNLVLTPFSQNADDVTAGYNLDIDIAMDQQTARIELTSPDAGELFEFTIQAPDYSSTGIVLSDCQLGDSSLLCQFHFFVSAALNTAYLILQHRDPPQMKYYVLDLSASSPSTVQPKELPIAESGIQWSPDQYEELQLLSLRSGATRNPLYYLHYNETHITQANGGMGFRAHTRAVDSSRGDGSVEENSYYSLLDQRQEILDFVVTDDVTDDWWQEHATHLEAVGFTIREKNIITGELLREVHLNMDDVQAIADQCGTTDVTAAEKQFFRGGKDKQPPPGKSQFLTTIRIQTTMVLTFFQGHGNVVPTTEDLGELIEQTQEFFQDVLQRKFTSSFADFTMANVVVPNKEEDSDNSNKPDQFSLEFVSNIVQVGDSLTRKNIADGMAGADFKRYINQFLRSFPKSSPFHFTFKVFFKGASKA